MKSIVYSAAAALGLALTASATPVARDVSDTSFDMDDTLSGSKPCASTAVIFARGTFDSGNIGVWVGPAFEDALRSKIPSLAFQGVDAQDYPANLEQYLDQDGSDSCADGLARIVDEYADKCPQAKIVVSGWSQGALCAHKALSGIDAQALLQVKALVTFGDPNAIMDNIPVPSGIAFESWCIDDNALPDALCATVGISLPTTVHEFDDRVIGALKSLPDLATGLAQTKAAAEIVPQLVAGFAENADTFAKDLVHGKVRRWMLTPQHFTYGNNGMAGEAATYIATL